MKHLSLTTMMVVSLLICLNRVQAQTIQAILNQVELHKQFIGSWKCDIAKDITCFWDVKPYGTGLECYYMYISNGEIVIEGKQLFGYDKKLDKYIVTFLPKGFDIEPWAE